MVLLRSLNEKRYASVRRLIEAALEDDEYDSRGSEHDRPLSEEFRPIYLSWLDRCLILWFDWLAHPERPPVLGRWIFWFAWRFSVNLRAYWSAREMARYRDSAPRRKSRGTAMSLSEQTTKEGEP